MSPSFAGRTVLVREHGRLLMQFCQLLVQVGSLAVQSPHAAAVILW
jgi:hypothetical protein